MITSLVREPHLIIITIWNLIITVSLHTHTGQDLGIANPRRHCNTKLFALIDPWVGGTYLLG